MAGLFITLEGIDGSGKTTQAKLLAERLRAAGCCVELTREPGGTRVGEAIRELVLSREHAMPAEAELFLYLADRAVHVNDVILPALRRNCAVVCERFSDSTLAYQGYGRGLDLEFLRRLEEIARGGLAPDLTIVIDIAPEQARLDGSRLDRLESEGEAFSRKVAEGFRDLARREPERIRLVDGTSGIEAVHAEVWRLAEGLLRRGGGSPEALPGGVS